MKIKEVCERTGLTRRAVRFYEEKGLIRPEIREENEYRDYGEADVRRLQLVARLRGYRFSVEEIRRLLERPQETKAVFDAHRKDLADEQEKGAAILGVLGRLHLPSSGGTEALYDALCRAEDKGMTLPPRDLEPDFGRFDDLTDEERAALSRRVAENIERIEKKRRWRWAALAASALVLTIVAGIVGLWVHRETGAVRCAGIIGQDVVFSDIAWDEEARAVVARFMASVLGNGAMGEYRLPLPNTEAGDVLSKSILPGETYAGFSYVIELPRREARRLGLLKPDGFLDSPAAIFRMENDTEFALRYAKLTAVYSGEGGHSLAGG